ncbi:hypothetical protein TNCV_1313271 [Trichonephila clavipes]|nr:hypothetical protein TNCV_1313271 [Trichonephila clavipes]
MNWQQKILQIFVTSVGGDYDWWKANSIISQPSQISVWCSKLWLTTGVPLTFCHDECLGLRSDTVRQVSNGVQGGSGRSKLLCPPTFGHQQSKYGISSDTVQRWNDLALERSGPVIVQIIKRTPTIGES